MIRFNGLLEVLPVIYCTDKLGGIFYEIRK